MLDCVRVTKEEGNKRMAIEIQVMCTHKNNTLKEEMFNSKEVYMDREKVLNSHTIYFQLLKMAIQSPSMLRFIYFLKKEKKKILGQIMSIASVDMENCPLGLNFVFKTHFLLV